MHRNTGDAPDADSSIAPAAPPPRERDQSLSDWVHDVVRRDIIEGRIGPQQVLVEGTLADRFGVSRGPAREALQRLRRSELVRAVPRLGYIVTSMSVRDYDEIFQTRLALEPMAAELTTRRIARGQVDADQLTRLSEAHLPLMQDGRLVDGPALAKTNHDFHLEVARLSGNRRIERIVDGLLEDLQRILAVLPLTPEILEQTWHKNPNLVKVMKSGDPESARDLMHAEVTKTYTLMRELAMDTDLPLGGRFS